VVIDAAGEIFGDLLNIVMQAKTLAEPGVVLITARVQRQVANLFVAKERGSHKLKDVPEAVTLYRIVRPTSGGHRRPNYVIFWQWSPITEFYQFFSHIGTKQQSQVSNE
jgi:class 3 adenylate cyclase